MQGWEGAVAGVAHSLTPGHSTKAPRAPAENGRASPRGWGESGVSSHMAAPLLQVGKKVEGSPRPARNGALLAESQGGIPGSQGTGRQVGDSHSPPGCWGAGLLASAACTGPARCLASAGLCFPICEVEQHGPCDGPSSSVCASSSLQVLVLVQRTRGSVQRTPEQ